MQKFKVDIIRIYKSGDTATIEVEAATQQERS